MSAGDHADGTDMVGFPPSRADLLGLLCAFVVVYCALEDRWEPLASLALVVAAFAVAYPRITGRVRIHSAPPMLEAEFERRTLSRPAQAGESREGPPPPAQSKGSAVD